MKTSSLVERPTTENEIVQLVSIITFNNSIRCQQLVSILCLDPTGLNNQRETHLKVILSVISLGAGYLKIRKN